MVDAGDEGNRAHPAITSGYSYARSDTLSGGTKFASGLCYSDHCHTPARDGRRLYSAYASWAGLGTAMGLGFAELPPSEIRLHLRRTEHGMGVRDPEANERPDPSAASLFIMPVWFLAGLADYLCHRATDIEHNAGPKESLIHLLMFGEFAVPILLCLFFEINALIFAIMILAFLAHEVTALWDVSYAIDRRYVSPFEQHVHSFLEMIPLMAGLIVGIQHWGQFLALFGFGPETARFSLEFKPHPLPLLYIVLVLGSSLLLELLPYLEELWRGIRARSRNPGS